MCPHMVAALPPTEQTVFKPLEVHNPPEAKVHSIDCSSIHYCVRLHTVTAGASHTRQSVCLMTCVPPSFDSCQDHH